MNIRIQFLGMAALMIGTSAAYADGHISVNINPFGWGAPPPVVYEPPRVYAPPPVVYYGEGHWGDYRDRRGRYHEGGRFDHRGRPDHHDDGDHRR